MQRTDFSREAFLLLKERGEKVSFAESLTGGLIAATFIANSGASCAIDESYVTYAPESKMRILGVKKETVDTVGVVSADCACQMAEGVRGVSGADWGVSATGFAGPEADGVLPVGTVFIGVSGKGKTAAHECHFAGNRSQIRIQAVQTAFQLLIEAINA